jgi:hypothetical protein
MIDWEVTTALETDHDVYYGVIPKPVMGALQDRGAPLLNCATLSVRRGYEHCPDHDGNHKRQLWPRIIAARKSALKQAALIGFDTLFLLLFHLISLKQAERLASKRLGLKGRVMVSPYAEIGMDIDKPHQLEIVRADLARRVSV